MIKIWGKRDFYTRNLHGQKELQKV